MIQMGRQHLGLERLASQLTRQRKRKCVKISLIALESYWDFFSKVPITFVMFCIIVVTCEHCAGNLLGLFLKSPNNFERYVVDVNTSNARQTELYRTPQVRV